MRWSAVLLAGLGSGCVIADDHETAVMVLMWDLMEVSAVLGRDAGSDGVVGFCGSEVQRDGAGWSAESQECSLELHMGYDDGADRAWAFHEVRWEGLSDPWTITNGRREGWVSFEDYRGRIDAAIDGATGTWDPDESGTDGTLSLEISYPKLPGGPFVARGTAAPGMVSWAVWRADDPDGACAGEATDTDMYGRPYIVAPCSL